MDYIDYDLIFGISDHAVDAEIHAPDNHVPELAKFTDESTSTPQEIDKNLSEYTKRHMLADLGSGEEEIKKGKKNEAGSSEKPVKETKPKKSPKKKPVIVKEIVQPDVSMAVTEPVNSPTVEETQEKETIPSKIGVFHRFKMESRKSSPQVVRKPQHTHQGVLFREVPSPVSPSSKK
ncbi:unnamed protein product [Lactuca saligna]|uniref:Uncharacterized protein n=1 Tax=Lactuca saligna TaxID=75948 RepID=A0AA35VIR3_LACSI|nr:unnamed protein product [Lactuca saligna]